MNSLVRPITNFDQWRKLGRLQNVFKSLPGYLPDIIAVQEVSDEELKQTLFPKSVICDVLESILQSFDADPTFPARKSALSTIPQ